MNNLGRTREGRLLVAEEEILQEIEEQPRTRRSAFLGTSY
jgi:hypothetical protein